MIRKKGKRLLEVEKKVDKTKLYSPEEAIKTVLQTKSAKFNETVELAMRLGVDPRHADQQVRGTVVLPNGTGKTKKILVLTQGENEEIAKKAGADLVGNDEFLEKIKGGWLDFDLIIATPDMMPKLGRFGKILGPKGLMPNPKSGTVTKDVAEAVKEFKAGKLAFKVDKFGSLHVPIGKSDYSLEKLTENFNTFVDKIMKIKPSASKGQYLKTCALSLTMGPGVRLDTVQLVKYIEEK